jgi:hypothetical protein
MRAFGGNPDIVRWSRLSDGQAGTESAQVLLRQHDTTEHRYAGDHEVLTSRYLRLLPSPDHPPDKLFAYLWTPDSSCSAEAPKDNSLLDTGSSEPLVQNCLDPAWNRHRSNMASLPEQVEADWATELRSRCLLRNVSGLAGNTHSIFCDGPNDLIQRMDVWFCVTRRNRAERHKPRADEQPKLNNQALSSAQREILAPLDKYLSWKSAFRQIRPPKLPIIPFCGQLLPTRRLMGYEPRAVQFRRDGRRE